MGFLLTLLLVVIGLLLLLLSLAVVAFGAYMALDDERPREPGVFLAVWWIPAVAASIGRDTKGVAELLQRGARTGTLRSR